MSGAIHLQVVPLNPRLLDIHEAARYLGVGVSTVRDWIGDEQLIPVPLPGSRLRGRVKAKPRQRKMAKILLDRVDLDRFIDNLKGENSNGQSHGHGEKDEAASG